MGLGPMPVTKVNSASGVLVEGDGDPAYPGATSAAVACALAGAVVVLVALLWSWVKKGKKAKSQQPP